MFNGRHERAEAWVRQRAGNLIEGIIADQKVSVRAAIEAGLADGLNPRDIALSLIGRVNKMTGRREGGIIGLSSAQADAVIRARSELQSGDPALMANYLSRQRRDARFDAMVKKAMAEGRKVSAADTEKIVGRYADRLLQLRGETIARTEAISALHASQFEAYQQLIESGAVRPDQVIKTWSATGDARTRDTHMALDGQKVRFDRPFTTPMGAMMRYPHDTSLGAGAEETINCRCTMSVRIKYLPD